MLCARRAGGESPCRPSRASGATTGGADHSPERRQIADCRRCRPGTTASLPIHPRLPPSLSHVVPCGAPRLSAWPDALRQSPVARSCQHRSRTKGPSLHQHYPASPVLRPYPPPQGAGSVPHDTTVGQHRLPATPRGFPCCTQPLFHTCRRHYPGGTVGCVYRSLPQRRRPSPNCRRVGFRITLFEACSAFTARYGLCAR